MSGHGKLWGVLFFALSIGCGSPKKATIGDRLWVSALPKSARDPFVGFVLTEQRGRSLGVFHEGSVYRGEHRLAGWKTTDEGHLVLNWLQEQRAQDIKIEECRPAAGYDFCIRLRGSPWSRERFMSRRRWTLKRKGKREESLGGEFQAMLTSAMDDES